MANRNKQDKFILIVSENPEIRYDEAARLAGYSKKRWKTVASNMRKHAGVQAKIAAIRGKKLAAAPTLESYHSLLNSAAEAALRGDPSAWVLLQCAQAHGKEVLKQEPKEEQSRAAVLVKFVESELQPEQAQTVNKFLGQFEANAGFPPGWSGRLTPEPQVIQAQSPALMPVPQPRSEDAVLLLPITETERRRLERMCMPVGGAIRHFECDFGHGFYESMWQRRADQTWGWSDCPRCWEPVAVQ